MLLINDLFQDLPFEISSEAKSYYFPEENVTVVIPPNTLGHFQKSCITPESHDTPRKDAKSKIYEFSPSGLVMQNRIMVIIPLFDSHSYNSNNMTLMYRENKTSDFVCTKNMTDDKPTWLFHRNTCYLFLNHFCGIYVSQVSSGKDSKQSLELEALLFYKYTEGIVELKLTFGCYNVSSSCSRKRVIEVCLHHCNLSQGAYVFESIHLLVCFFLSSFVHDHSKINKCIFFNFLCGKGLSRRRSA